MDLQLIRSFVSVADSGSFAAASDRLFVTQSAVSLRIQRLEEQIGRPLFTRSKDGVTLTAAGREFRSFALTILRNWEMARQRISALEEPQATFAIGAQQSLWPRFGFRWLDRLREAIPDLALRADMGRPESLSQMLITGTVQAILTYSAVNQAGLVAEPLLEDQLVMVASWPDGRLADLNGRYLVADWGPEFLRAHAEALPHLAKNRLVMSLGVLTAGYILHRPYAAYLPARYVKHYVDEGRLFLITDAPVFAHPAWVVWREEIDSELHVVARQTLREVVERAEKDAEDMLEQR